MRSDLINRPAEFDCEGDLTFWFVPVDCPGAFVSAPNGPFTTEASLHEAAERFREDTDGEFDLLGLAIDGNGVPGVRWVREMAMVEAGTDANGRRLYVRRGEGSSTE